MTAAKHPRQPIVTDEYGVERFKQNKIVRELLDRARAAKVTNLDALARMGFSDEDWQQFVQLIGYRVSSELSFVDEQDGCPCDIHRSERAPGAQEE